MGWKENVMGKGSEVEAGGTRKSWAEAGAREGGREG